MLISNPDAIHLDRRIDWYFHPETNQLLPIPLEIIISQGLFHGKSFHKLEKKKKRFPSACKHSKCSVDTSSIMKLTTTNERIKARITLEINLINANVC